MASVQTGSYDGRYLKLTVVEESTSVANNTSTLRWTLESIGGSVNYYTIYNWGVWVNGQQIYGTQTTGWSSYAFPAAKGSTTGTIIVPHNDDGTASAVGFTLKGCVYYNRDNTYNGSVSLSTIARASQPSCITYPNTTQNIGNLGDTITIHMNRKSSSFKHTVRYAWGNKSGTIATNVGDNCQWTVPKNFAENVTNGTSGTGTVYVDTYNGSTKIGTKSVGFTANIPNTSEFQPSISSVTLSEVGSVPSSFGFYIQSLSKIKGKITASGAYGSTISSYSTTINNQSFTTAEWTTSLLSVVNPKLKVVVKDSRGRSATYETTLTALKYEVPTINSFASYRNSADASKIDLVFSCSIYKLQSKNTKSFQFYYKKATDSQYTIIEVDASKITSRESGNIVIYSVNYSIVSSDPSASYVAYLVANDMFNSIPSSETFINTVFKLININSTKTAFAIGKLHEKDGYIENALPQANYENIHRIEGTYDGLVLSCPSIEDGKINFNSTDKTLELEIGGTTYAISLQQKS